MMPRLGLIHHEPKEEQTLKGFLEAQISSEFIAQNFGANAFFSNFPFDI